MFQPISSPFEKLTSFRTASFEREAFEKNLNKRQFELKYLTFFNPTSEVFFELNNLILQTVKISSKKRSNLLSSLKD